VRNLLISSRPLPPLRGICTACWRPALLLALLILPAGCQAAGAIANSIPEPFVAAAYPGLKNQHVAIMVWTDRGTSTDHPSIQPDLSKTVAEKLQEAADAGISEVKNIQWVSPEKILQFQEDHPEMESDPAEEVALRLPVTITRLIYIEIPTFSLHSDEAPDLTRGAATADIKVVEIANGKTTVAYQEDNINIVYPTDSPPEGMPGLDEEHTYHETIDTLADAIAKRFVSHESDVQ
jgi:hypothetical protein